MGGGVERIIMIPRFDVFWVSFLSFCILFLSVPLFLYSMLLHLYFDFLSFSFLQLSVYFISRLGLYLLFFYFLLLLFPFSFLFFIFPFTLYLGWVYFFSFPLLYSIRYVHFISLLCHSPYIDISPPPLWFFWVAVSDVCMHLLLWLLRLPYASCGCEIRVKGKEGETWRNLVLFQLVFSVLRARKATAVAVLVLFLQALTCYFCSPKPGCRAFLSGQLRPNYLLITKYH